MQNSAVLHPRSSILAFSICIPLITFAVFLPSLRNDFVDWDDLNMIVHNPHFNPPTWAGIGWYWIHPGWNLYQPLTTTLWGALAWLGWVNSVDHFGGHMNPAIFHLAGACLQAINAWLLFRILWHALSDRWAAAIGAMVFAIHPIQVEAVVFAGAVNTALAGTFGLLAIQQYLMLRDPQKPASHRASRWTLASVSLLLALLAKPSAVAIAPLGFILDLAIHHRGWKSSILAVVPWIFLEVPCVIYTRLFQHGSEAAKSPVWTRPVIAGDAITQYLARIFCRLHFAIDYGRTPAYVMQHPWWPGLIIPISLALFAWFSRHRLPMLSAGAAVFIVALLPNSGLATFDFQLVSTVADRYIYLSMVGISLVVGVLVARIAWFRWVMIPVLAGLIIRTEFQIPTWHNGETLYRHALEVNPNSWLAAGNLAVVIADQSPDQAIALCRQAIKDRNDRPDVWNTLGTLLIAKGDRSEAIQAFQHAHDLSPTTPTFIANLARARESKQ